MFVCVHVHPFVNTHQCQSKVANPASLDSSVFSILPVPIAFAGLALVYVIETVDTTQYAVRISSDVENLMTSLERVMTYTQFDSEPGYKIERTPPKTGQAKEESHYKT